MGKRIKICDLEKEYLFLKKDINSYLQPLFKSHSWVLGKALADFEKAAAKFLGVKYAVGVASGTDALVLALLALAKKQKKERFSFKDEIITTPFTFIATAEAIVRAGARPVFCDIDPASLNLSPQSLKKAITKNTVGILPVHLYGRPAEILEIAKIARKNGLFVLEDCAQSFGAEYEGKKTGSFADCSCFSFFPSKNLGAYGDGGMIATNSKFLCEYIKNLRNHGQTKQYWSKYLGYNSRLDSLQAAILLAKLKQIKYLNSLRRKKALLYNQKLSRIKEIEILPDNYGCIYHLYTVKVKRKRNELLKFLNRNKIEARIYYPYLLSNMPPFKKAKAFSLKNANQAVREVISLPLHPFMADAEINFVCQKIVEFFRI